MMSRLRERKYNTHNPFRQNVCDDAAGEMSKQLLTFVTETGALSVTDSSCECCAIHNLAVIL